MNEDVEMELLSYEEELGKCLNRLKDEYAVLKVGRANPHILDRVYVDYYGSMTPINQTSNISVVDARMITVSPWDNSILHSIKKSIMEANLGVGISDDGKLIRLSFPVLTEERRREVAKDAKKTLEETKVAMRNKRRDVLDVFKSLKKDSKISEDEYNTLDKKVQKLLDDYILSADDLCNKKVQEIMEV